MTFPRSPAGRPSILVVALLAAACTTPLSQEPVEGGLTGVGRAPTGSGTLRIAGAGLDELDPARAYSTTSWFLARGVFRTLVAPGPARADEPRPALVGDLATDTGTADRNATRWTFTLRAETAFGAAVGNEPIDGVTGEQVTCDDVKYGIERLFRPQVGAAYAFYYEALTGVDDFRAGTAEEIVGISCSDDRTVVFDLDRSLPDWPLRLSLPAATPVPRSVAAELDATDEKSYGDQAVPTGPYAIDSIDGDGIRLMRSEHWDPAGDPIRAARFRRVRWRTDLAAGTAIERILDGRLDLLIGLEPRGPALARVVGDRDASRRLIHEPSGCIRALYLDTTRPPFDRVIVRRAAALALDRYALKRMIGGPASGSVATSVLPPGIPGHLPPETFDPFGSQHGTGDVEAARRMLRRAAFSDWDRPITVTGGPGSSSSGLLTSVRTDLQRLGFSEVRIRTLGADGLTPLTRSRQRVHLGVGVAWCKDVDDASTILRPLFHGAGRNEATSFNLPRLDDARLNEMIDRASALPLGSERTLAWSRANRRATHLAAWIPWSWDKVTILYGERLLDANYLSFLTQIDWPNAAIDR